MRKEPMGVHSGTYHDVEARGANTPVFISSAFNYLDRDRCPCPRCFNTPNQEAVVRKMCALAGGKQQ